MIMPHILRISLVIFLEISLCFSSGVFLFPETALAQDGFPLPDPGQRLELTSAYTPATLRGLRFFAENPLRFDFIIDAGTPGRESPGLEAEAETLIKYFLATLTIPEDNLWVNLSPYEADRVIPDNFAQTEMGRDLLAQDYLLKQMTASLMYPEADVGAHFWEKVYSTFRDQDGLGSVPVKTFNKIWIIPDRATIYEQGDVVYVTDSHLKVMLAEDYEARKAVRDDREATPSGISEQMDPATAQILRDTIVPAIEKEVNEGKTFAKLRQIYHAMILATWYKMNLRETLLARVYVDQSKIQGVEVDDPLAREKIYQQYLQAFQQGIYNYIRKEQDPVSHAPVFRKYFAGGLDCRHLRQVIQSSPSGEWQAPIAVVLARGGLQLTQSSPLGNGVSSPAAAEEVRERLDELLIEWANGQLLDRDLSRVLFQLEPLVDNPNLDSEALGRLSGAFLDGMVRFSNRLDIYSRLAALVKRMGPGAIPGLKDRFLAPAATEATLRSLTGIVLQLDDSTKAAFLHVLRQAIEQEDVGEERKAFLSQATSMLDSALSNRGPEVSPGERFLSRYPEGLVASEHILFTLRGTDVFEPFSLPEVRAGVADGRLTLTDDGEIQINPERTSAGDFRAGVLAGREASLARVASGARMYEIPVPIGHPQAGRLPENRFILNYDEVSKSVFQGLLVIDMAGNLSFQEGVSLLQFSEDLRRTRMNQLASLPEEGRVPVPDNTLSEDAPNMEELRADIRSGLVRFSEQGDLLVVGMSPQEYQQHIREGRQAQIVRFRAGNPQTDYFVLSPNFNQGILPNYREVEEGIRQGVLRMGRDFVDLSEGLSQADLADFITQGRTALAADLPAEETLAVSGKMLARAEAAPQIQDGRIYRDGQGAWRFVVEGEEEPVQVVFTGDLQGEARASYFEKVRATLESETEAGKVDARTMQMNFADIDSFELAVILGKSEEVLGFYSYQLPGIKDDDIRQQWQTVKETTDSPEARREQMDRLITMLRSAPEFSSLVSSDGDLSPQVFDILEENAVFADLIFVFSDYRGRNVGRRLIQEFVAKIARERESTGRRFFVSEDISPQGIKIMMALFDRADKRSSVIQWGDDGDDFFRVDVDSDYAALTGVPVSPVLPASSPAFQTRGDKDLGGIDLNPSWMVFDRMGLGLNLDMAGDLFEMTAGDVAGFAPVIYDFLPIENLTAFLGVPDPLP